MIATKIHIVSNLHHFCGCLKNTLIIIVDVIYQKFVVGIRVSFQFFNGIKTITGLLYFLLVNCFIGNSFKLDVCLTVSSTSLQDFLPCRPEMIAFPCICDGVNAISTVIALLSTLDGRSIRLFLALHVCWP